MTLEEFDIAQPVLARVLRDRLGVHLNNYNADATVIIDGVYLREDGRWEAQYTEAPSWETGQLIEARCDPSCQRGPGGPRVWVDPEHVCCVHCIADAGHHYQTVHE